jgi:hypothetical protein
MQKPGRAAPPGLLRDARGALARLEHGHHLGQRHVPGREHDEEVIEHIGRFRGELRAVAAHRLDDGLDGFLAELLGAFLRALGKELRGPGTVGIGALARLDGGGEPFEDGHASLTGMPAAAMWALASPMVNSPKWKIEAASTADAPPSVTPSTR